MAGETAAWDRIDTPFGSWALDVEKLELCPTILSVIQISSRTSLGIYKDVFFVKVLENEQGLEVEPGTLSNNKTVLL